MQQGKTVIIFSLEMPGSSLMMRLLAGHTGIDSRHLRRGFVGDAQWAGAHPGSIRNIRHSPLCWWPIRHYTPQSFAQRRGGWNRSMALIFWLSDYIQLMRVPGKHDTREQAVGRNQPDAQSHCPWTQCSRYRSFTAQPPSGQPVPDKHPLLSDLRESGAIEQDARRHRLYLPRWGVSQGRWQSGERNGPKLKFQNIATVRQAALRYYLMQKLKHSGICPYKKLKKDKMKTNTHKSAQISAKKKENQ